MILIHTNIMLMDQSPSFTAWASKLFMAESHTSYCGPVHETHAKITVCGRPNYLNYCVKFIVYT